MKILNFLFRILRLPFDLHILTLLYCVGILRSVYRGMSRLLRRDHEGQLASAFSFCTKPSLGICRCHNDRLGSNHFVYRWLCPDFERHAGTDVEHTSAPPTSAGAVVQSGRLRIVTVGVGLVVGWLLCVVLLSRYGAALQRPLQRWRSSDNIRAAEKALQRQDVTGAIALFRRAAEENPHDAGLQYKLAVLLLQSGRRDEAEIHFRAAMEQDPSQWRSALELARLTAGNGRLAAAAAFARTVLENNPQHAEANIIVASYLLQLGETDSVRAHLDTASQTETTDIDLLTKTAALYLLIREPTIARSLYDRALAMAPESATVQTGLAYIDMVAGNFDGADMVLNRVLDRHPDDVSAIECRARLYTMKGDLDRAIATYAKLVERPDPAHVHLFEYATLIIGAGRIDEGCAILRGVIADRPDYIQPRLLLAETYRRRGMASLAAEEADRVLDYQPHNVEALKIAIRSNIAIKNSAGALAAAQRLIRLDMKNPDHVSLLAAAQESGGNSVAATDTYLMLSDLLPTSPVPHLKIALLKMAAGDVHGAISYTRLALERDPDNLVGLNNLAFFMIASDDDDVALEGFERAVALKKAYPANAAVTDTLGLAYCRAKAFDRARQCFEDANEIDPGYPDAFFHLGQTLLETGDRKGAAKAIGAALTINPTFHGAREARRLLRELAE